MSGTLRCCAVVASRLLGQSFKPSAEQTRSSPRSLSANTRQNDAQSRKAKTLQSHSHTFCSGRCLYPRCAATGTALEAKSNLKCSAVSHTGYSPAFNSKPAKKFLKSIRDCSSLNCVKTLHEHPGCQETARRSFHCQVRSSERKDQGEGTAGLFPLPCGTYRIPPSSLCPSPTRALSGEEQTGVSTQGRTVANGRVKGQKP